MLTQGAEGARWVDEPLPVGQGDFRVADLTHRTGLKAEDVDQVVLGFKAEEPLSGLLIVRTREPYVPEKILGALRAEKLSGGGKKPLYTFPVEKPPLRPVLWCGDSRTLIFGLLPGSFDAIPLTPRAGLEHLPAEVQVLLKERMEPVAPVWVVGHARDWSETLAGPFLEKLGNAPGAGKSSLQSFAAWVQPGPPPMVKVVLRGDSDAAAEHLEKALHKLAGSEDPSWKSVREGPWLTAQFRCDWTGLHQKLAK